MAEFSLSPDELASVCRRMVAQTDGIPANAEQVRASEVGTTDFGGTRFTEIARLYAHVIQDVIPGLLTGYASAGRSMSDRLASTLGGYASAEAAATDAMRDEATR
jgi:hypothetical protein